MDWIVTLYRNHILQFNITQHKFGYDKNCGIEDDYESPTINNM